MTDVAYLCHNCGSVHEIESIRENLILDLRTAASYELSGHRGMMRPRARALRWRIARGLALALWPGPPRHLRLAPVPLLVRGPPVAVPDGTVLCRPAARGRHARAGNPASASADGGPAVISADRSTSAPRLRP
jgi:hypothetical protein